MSVNHSHHTSGPRSNALRIQQLNHHHVLLEFDSEVDVEGSSETIKDGMVDEGPCNLECIPCNNKEGLQQYRGGKRVGPRVDSSR